MLLRIHHETKLTYSAPVSETVFEVRMAPPTNEDQTGMGYNLRISPQAPVTSYRDGFSNRVDLFNVATHYRELVIQATTFVRTHRRIGRERIANVAWPGERTVPIDVMEFLQPSPLVDRSAALLAFVSTLPTPAGTFAAGLGALHDAINNRLRFERKVTNPRTPVGEALSLGRGVCQDFAHLFIGACRALGVPARYVSGYINQPGEIATHAWCQVWVNEVVGWLDFDPTRGGFVGDDHALIAVGRDYSDVPPNRGLWKGRAEESMAVAVKVEPVERIPLEWNEWTPLGLRPSSGSGQFQRQSQGVAVAAHRNTRSAYPNQRAHRASLLQQQGEQQQQ